MAPFRTRDAGILLAAGPVSTRHDADRPNLRSLPSAECAHLTTGASLAHLSLIRQDQIPAAQRASRSVWWSQPHVIVSDYNCKPDSALNIATVLSKAATLADFMDLALIRCRANGQSLRTVARSANIPPAMLSLIRHGQQGLPLPRIPATAHALGLNPEEAEVFIQLARSNQAKRADQRGRLYVDEIESDLRQARAIIADILDWASSAGCALPTELHSRARETIDGNPVITRSSSSPPTPQDQAKPWNQSPPANVADWAQLEACDDRGKPILAEYRIRVRDSTGLLMHGDILIVPGLQAAIHTVQQQYRSSFLGVWPSGYYLCEILRKAIPAAYVNLPIHIPDSQDEE